ncbi:MAG: SprB repeat-containing protein [Bacteroidia bacterium]
MKKYSSLVLFLFLLFSISFLNFSAFATTDLDIVITVSHYEGGSDITCHGVNDGVMEAVIVGGTAPYSYQWTNGSFTAFTKRISGLAPGDYVFTVIDANNDTVSKSAKIHDITAISTNPEISNYSGYNISYQGGDDGDIHLGTSGGVSPYSFLWSTTQQEENISGLSSGNYTVTITDANACVLTQTFTLTEPTPLHVVSISSPLHHGYNISCNGGDDGSISLSVAGGVSPYTFLWNSGDTTQNIDTLKVGTFTVQIHDANNVLITRSITLTQPEPVLFDLAATVYGNGKNTTCYNCSDGYVSSNANGGVAPYTYSWNTGQTTGNLSGVIARNYSLIVTDQNGCHKSSEITLTQPDRDDWTVKGNSGTVSDSNYIGTNDNKDFRIRTNNTERIRIYNSGTIEIKSALKVDTISSDSLRSVFVDTQGVLRVGSHGTSQQPCVTPTNRWVTNYCNHTNDIYNVPASGNVGIGTSDIPSGYKLAVNGRVICEEVKVKLHSNWPDYVFRSDYKLMSLDELKKFISKNKHLPDVPPASEMDENGNSLGEMQSKLMRKIEELTLYVLQQNEQLEKLKSDNSVLTKKVNDLTEQVNK